MPAIELFTDQNGRYFRPDDLSLSFFEELSSFEDLFHILANNSDVHQKILVFNLSGNIETSLYVTHFYRSPGNTSKTFHVMFFDG